MRNNSVVIATNATFLADILQGKLRDAGMKVFVAVTEGELTMKIQTVYPRLIFIESCFRGNGTDTFVKRTAKQNKNVVIVVWAAEQVKPLYAARFIDAGAESFFSLRDSESNIDAILLRIAGGRRFCPAEVEAVIDKDNTYQTIGEELTEREIEIMKLCIKGQSVNEIGKALAISPNTVKFHKKNMYRKCGGEKTVDILRYGLTQGIIRPEEF